MTYTDQVQSYIDVEAVDSPTEDSTETTLEKLKSLQKEGGQRTQRISEILRAAFAEVSKEFKAGRTEMSPLIKEVTAETMDVVKENGQKASQTVNQAWKAADDDDSLERLIRFVRLLAQTAKEKLMPQLKVQADKLDDVLTGRYGDRYTTLKNRFQ